MNSNTLIQDISGRLDIAPRKAESMLSAFAKVVADAALEGDSVAIPSFGTFAPVKADEEIVTDHVTGKRMMLPPQISFVFTPAAMLRKKLFSNESDN